MGCISLGSRSRSRGEDNLLPSGVSGAAQVQAALVLIFFNPYGGNCLLGKMDRGMDFLNICWIFLQGVLFESQKILPPLVAGLLWLIA